MGEIRDFYEKQPHEVCELICINCKRRWIGVFHSDSLLVDLYCPGCEQSGYVIMTGQPVDYMLDEDDYKPDSDTVNTILDINSESDSVSDADSEDEEPYIRVGDEVVYNFAGINYYNIVIEVISYGEHKYKLLNSHGCCNFYHDTNNKLRKTGKTYPIDNMIRQLSERFGKDS